MSIRRLFRTLVVAEWIVVVIAAVLSLFPETLLPEALAAYLQSQEAEPRTWQEMTFLILGFGLLIAALVASIGLFLFWAPARPLYLITTVLGLMTTPFFGAQVEGAWEAFFFDVSTFMCGVLIALMYFSPLSSEFVRKRSVS